MKRFFLFISTFAFLMAAAPAVSADVIADPVAVVIQSINLKLVLTAVCVVALLSGLFLWFTRKK